MIAGLPLLGSVEFAALLTAVGVLVVFVGLYLVAVPQMVDQRLAQFVGAYRQATRPAVGQLQQGPPELIEAIERGLMRRRVTASTRMLLERANLKITLAEFIATRIVAAIALGALVGAVLSPTFQLLALVPAAAAAIAGSYVPVAIVRVLVARRLNRLEAQLPDALDMVAASLQAGSGLGQAFELIGREMAPPISEEFRRVMHEVELGLSLNEALTNLVDRLGSEDVDLVVTSINIQSRVGGNLVHVLRVITQTIRERIRIKGEIRVLTSQQRLSAIIISAVPPVLTLILFLINPTYMGRLFEPGFMRYMLIGGIAAMLAGIYLLRRITDIEV